MVNGLYYFEDILPGMQYIQPWSRCHAAFDPEVILSCCSLHHRTPLWPHFDKITASQRAAMELVSLLSFINDSRIVACLLRFVFLDLLVFVKLIYWSFSQYGLKNYMCSIFKSFTADESDSAIYIAENSESCMPRWVGTCIHKYTLSQFVCLTKKMIKAKEMERSQTSQCHVRNTRKNRKKTREAKPRPLHGPRVRVRVHQPPKKRKSETTRTRCRTCIRGPCHLLPKEDFSRE
ncbi:uncharacterized protein LOC142541107 isoform X2 [Primulina tabacum]|uniref:uncharacterized protein LOC142541107 isoform X2 n=1 Tax=Primulina tabacum TaxID=48773 RepID=UPI003F59FAB5